MLTFSLNLQLFQDDLGCLQERIFCVVNSCRHLGFAIEDCEGIVGLEKSPCWQATRDRGIHVVPSD